MTHLRLRDKIPASLKAGDAKASSDAAKKAWGKRGHTQTNTGYTNLCLVNEDATVVRVCRNHRAIAVTVSP